MPRKSLSGVHQAMLIGLCRQSTKNRSGMWSSKPQQQRSAFLACQRCLLNHFYDHFRFDADCVE
jgi:hypothetical protein